MDNIDNIQALNTEKNILISELSSAYSPQAGDWLIVKLLEAIVSSEKFWKTFSGVDLPYTKEEVLEFINKRKERRHRINEIEAQLNASN